VCMYLESENLRLDEVEGLSVNLNKTLSGLNETNQYFPLRSHRFRVRTLQWATAVAVGGEKSALLRGSQIQPVSNLTCLLLAEALNTLGSRGHVCNWRELECSSLRWSSMRSWLVFDREVEVSLDDLCAG